MGMAGTRLATQTHTIRTELVRIMTTYHTTPVEAGQVFALCIAQDCYQEGWPRREIDRMVSDIGLVALTLPDIRTI